MAEERWHDFAKEKPSEDMEGRNFIVSNGHYEKIATWCGYWENEPFMGDRLCDEVVRWKFYFTPEEEKANEATRTEPTPMKCDELKRKYSDVTGPYYGYNEVNEAIAELNDKLDEKDKEIAELKARIKLDDDEMAGFLQLEEECGGGDLRNYIAELKQKLEDVQASHYAEMVDAGMRERRLRRALWLARANSAEGQFSFWCARFATESGFTKTDIRGYTVNTKRKLRTIGEWIETWKNVKHKCLKKAEEYK